MKADKSKIPRCSDEDGRSAFTLTELLVIVAVIAVLVLLRLPALARATNQTKRAQCAANLQQFTLAVQIYGGDHSNKLPVSTAGYWAWDVPWVFGDVMNRYGAGWKVLYCPGTAPLFKDPENYELYTYIPGNFRELGYANTFASSSVMDVNRNQTLIPQRIQVALGTYVTPLASERVLLADATISLPGGNTNKSAAINWTSITGGFYKRHTSPHLNGDVPSGGNVSTLDGHVEWRDFSEIQGRTVGGSPEFWW